MCIRDRERRACGILTRYLRISAVVVDDEERIVLNSIHDLLDIRAGAVSYTHLHHLLKPQEEARLMERLAERIAQNGWHIDYAGDLVLPGRK